MAARNNKKAPVKSPRAPRGTVYQDILDEMAVLKVDEAVAVPVDKGVSAATVQNRLNATFRRFPVKPKKGYRFGMLTSEDGTEVLIVLKKIKEAD